MTLNEHIFLKEIPPLNHRCVSRHTNGSSPSNTWNPALASATPVLSPSNITLKLQIPLSRNLTTIQPQDLEKKTTGGRPTPQNFLIKTKRLCMKLKSQKRRSIKIMLKSTEMEFGGERGAAFSVLENNTWMHQWSAKINDNNTVYQAELTALLEVVNYATQNKSKTSTIHVGNKASIMAASNPKQQAR
ncbi:hypothetical protein AVEN_42690-1 [Araneus ventricosus]|uniref:RNase H type-1 domain-containing protein n=1 Tax=Araneus ventricosus TaxID=182803 RepID=A0A4Y2BMR2_ARAVE|nr:hypothetical protein AVEN_42690-1 [Araneus ventricosus]